MLATRDTAGLELTTIFAKAAKAVVTTTITDVIQVGEPSVQTAMSASTPPTATAHVPAVATLKASLTYIEGQNLHDLIALNARPCDQVDIGTD